VRVHAAAVRHLQLDGALVQELRVPICDGGCVTLRLDPRDHVALAVQVDDLSGRLAPESAIHRQDAEGLLREIGRLASQTGDYESAHKAFNRAIVLEPNEPLNYYYLGEFLEKIDDLRNAAGAYLNARNLAPLWDKPVFRLGQVYAKLDRLADAYYYLGRSHLLQDEDERAIADFERALKIIGDNSPRGQMIKEELKTLKSRKR